MKDKCIFIIPVVEEDPGLFSKLFKTFENIDFCEVLFVISPKNNSKYTYQELTKDSKNLHAIIAEKNYTRSVLFQKGLYHFNNFIKKEDHNFNYIVSIKKFNTSYLDIILDGIVEIERNGLDVMYCLVEKREIPLRFNNVGKKIKKSILDTFRSPSFIASANFVNNIYSNPFNKVVTFYYLLRNAKFKPKYS
ncbi:hypothetical protein [Polaribacter sp.]|uniref:hypothetical protein n=1 Tax=Polaribacter sp. TaxID=1920175 RepID=UPI003F6A1279